MKQTWYSYKIFLKNYKKEHI